MYSPEPVSAASLEDNEGKTSPFSATGLQESGGISSLFPTTLGAICEELGYLSEEQLDVLVQYLAEA